MTGTPSHRHFRPCDTMFHVLYVDDEPDLLEICKMFLEANAGFAIDTLTAAGDALVTLPEKQYDAIVSDYQMPCMDGIAFLKAVRASGNTIPFILFTGRGREEIVIQALNEGADFYLQKGGDPESQFAELAHKIRQAIQQRRAEASIRDHERREADIINFLPDATFAIDRRGTVISWNRAIEEMTGVPAAEMLGKGEYEYAIPFYGTRRRILIDLIFESDEVIAKNYVNIIHNKGILIADTTLPRPQGRNVTLMGKASPLYDQQGQVVGAIESIRDLTERKKAEDELRAAYSQIMAAEEELKSQLDEIIIAQTEKARSEEKYRAIFETTGSATILIDKDTIIVLVNTGFSELSGYTKEELEGKRSWTEFIVQEDLEKMRYYHDIRRTDPDLAPKIYEFRFIDHAGQIRHCIVHMSMIHGTSMSVASVVDITSRKRAEDALRESEKKFRMLFDNVSEAVYIHEILPDGMPGKFLEVNNVMCERLGYTREELLAMTVGEIISDAHRQNLLPEIRQKMIQSGFYEFYGEHKRKDGSVFPVEINSHRFLYSGRPVVLVSSRDITERKKGEDALRESEEKYRTVVENSNDTIFIYRDNRLLFANKKTSDLTGYSNEQLLSMNMWDLIHPEDQSRLKDGRDRRMAGKAAPVYFTARVMTSGGEARICEFVVNQILYHGSLAVVGIVRDITECWRGSGALMADRRILTLGNDG